MNDNPAPKVSQDTVGSMVTSCLRVEELGRPSLVAVHLRCSVSQTDSRGVGREGVSKGAAREGVSRGVGFCRSFWLPSTYL